MPSTFSAYLLTATLLTVAPGPDTVMVLRAATGRGTLHGTATALGIAIGCLSWGALAAYGLAGLMTAAPWAFVGLKWAGALYLIWLGLKLVRHPRRSIDGVDPCGRGPVWRAFASGLVTNLLNPKVGLFYLTLLPQFLPTPGAATGDAALGLAVVHVGIALVWFSTLGVLGGRLRPLLSSPRGLMAMDRCTGLVLVLVGAGLTLAP